MSLQRFTESYSVGANYVKKLPATPALRERYSEAFKALSGGEYSKLSESVTSDDDVVLYKFPVSRFDHLNQNRRKYPRKLWERVINTQQNEWKGRVGLADHPPEESDGEFKNASIVWLDMEIDDENKLIWAVGTFVGPYGRLAQEIVDKGGRIGFSSSGFGELGYDGTTVDPETYVLERCADIVLNPSQDVFGEANNALNIEYAKQRKESVEESSESETKRIKETRMADNTNNTPAEALHESAPVSRGVSKLEEKKFRKDIERFIEDADKISDPQARLTELAEILTYFDSGVAPDLREMVESKIKDEKVRLENLIAEARKVEETFGTANNEQIKLGVALLAEEFKVVEAEAKDWEAIAVALKESNQKLKDNVQTLTKAMEAAPKATEIAELKERIEFLELQRKRQLYAYNEETQVLAESIKAAEASVHSVEAQLMEAKLEAKDLLEKKALLEGRLEAANKLNEKKDASLAEIKSQILTAKTELTEAKDRILILEGQASRLQDRLKEATLAKDATSAEFEAFKKKIEEESIPKVMPRFEERANGYFNFNEAGGSAVESYWADLIERHGASIVPYERQIRGQKTYREASAAYMKYLPYIDENANQAELARLPEGYFPKQERRQMLEEAGMRFDDDENDVVSRNSSWAK